jgi:hypothetical protein
MAEYLGFVVNFYEDTTDLDAVNPKYSAIAWCVAFSL